MDKLSVVIITKNEAENIAATIAAALKVADEIIVVDSGSTDKTKEICLAKGVVFIEQEWLGFGNQRNFAVTKSSNNYILVVDADEVLSEELIKNILKLKQEGLAEKIYLLKRLNFYYGKFIRHGMENPDIKPRLYHKDFATWNNNIVHEYLEFDSLIKTKLLKGDLLHYTQRTISSHIIQANFYNNLFAQKAFESGKNPGIIKLVLNPVFTFIKAYFIKAGFLDGWHGFMLAKIHASNVFRKYAIVKILFYEQKISLNK